MQWITADFNNDSYDKWLLICFLMSENIHWQKKCHQNHCVKAVSIKKGKIFSAFQKIKQKGSLIIFMPKACSHVFVALLNVKEYKVVYRQFKIG